MSERHLNVGDTFCAGGVLRHIFLETLASSPNTVSSSSSASLSPSNSNDVSIETCIKYLQSRVPLIWPDDALDKFRNRLNEAAPNGRVNWKMFQSVVQHWMASIDSKIQDGNNNLNEAANDDRSSNPDGNTTVNVSDVPDDNAKSSEFVEWSIVPMKRVNNDTVTECKITNASIKSLGETDNATEVELRLRIRRLDEDNAWLRDELERIEELAANYQRQYYTMHRRLHKMSEKCNQLERENEEQKEMIVSMEEEEKRCVSTLEKAERERRSYIAKLEMHKQLIPNLNTKIDKLKDDKKYFIKQLTICRTKLKEKEDMCEILQEKYDQLTEINTNLEEHYEKIVRNLEEKSDDLQNENVKLYSRMSSGHPSVELNLTSSGIYLNSSLESLPNGEHKIPPQNSLYDELKASGYSFDDQGSSKIRELEEELDWYNEEICNATKKIEELIQKLGHESKSNDKYGLNDESTYQARHILILLDKITLLSDVVKEETFRKPTTNELGIQVSAEPLTNKVLKEFNISTFEDGLKTPIARRERASGDFFNVYFTIGPGLIEKQRDADILPKSIYTNTERLNRRRWGRNFHPIAVGTRSGDAPINDDSSPSLHSSTELESKIILHTPMHVDDNNSRVINAISPSTHKHTNIFENSYCETYSEYLSLSPICGSPNMTEKNEPKRKQSVFSRTYNIEKGFDTPHKLTERIASSTPAPDDNPITNFVPIFATTAYRTEINCSDSSDSFSMSKLQPSIEEDTLNREISAANEPVFIAPPKLNLDIENKRTELNVTCPIIPDSISSLIANDVPLTMAQNNMEICANPQNDKSELIASSTMSSTDNINLNGEIQSLSTDLHTKNSSKSIDNTRTLQPDINNSMSQRVTSGCGECIATKKRVVESTSVTVAMSSGEDSSDLSDSDVTANCNVTNGAKSNDEQNRIQDKLTTLNAPQSNADSSSHVFTVSFENNLPTSTMDLNKASNKREIVPAMKRSRSESESLIDYCRQGYRCVCSIKKPKTNGNSEEYQLMVFPSLSDIRLQKAGIANLHDDDIEINYLPENELAQKYTAFSLGLSTDRLTLLRRRALSIRQRDQTEQNLIGEVTTMHQNIQELAPLCFDSETIERIERARHQVDTIAHCAHEVSCTAETLGAIQQEYRLSKAVYVADKYLRMLRNRCEKLAIDLAETKRILMEHNIIIDEHTGECSEELTRLRYRGLTTNNRTMTAKRRASIATISRPMIIGHDAIKDGVRQRNSVPGRVALRRPSFNAESQRWEIEKLNRTESSNSVGELREIYEQAESRRASREENNNIMRLQVNICESDELNLAALEMPSHNGEENTVGSEIDEESQQVSRRISRFIFGSGNHGISWRLMLWCIIISFFIGFYVKDAVSSGPCVVTPFKWWSLEEILDRHVEVRNTAPRPI